MRRNSHVRSMSSPLPLVTLSRHALGKLTTRRPFETKLGEVVHLFDTDQGLRTEDIVRAATDSGARFGILGVPEDVGPRANCGRGGAHTAWPSFLASFLNMQDNDSLRGSDVIILGHVDCDDILTRAQGVSTEELRTLVPLIDERVQAVAQASFEANLELIVIGGGHNNALPLIRAARDASGAAAVVCNLDPHADMRQCSEGRHSGNGFSNALAEGTLGKYFLAGYHRRYNSAATLDALRAYEREGRARASCFEDWLDGGAGVDRGLHQSLDECVPFLLSPRGQPAFGIEVDMDAIIGMPTSASSPSGVTVEVARQYVRRLASAPSAAQPKVQPQEGDGGRSGTYNGGWSPLYLHLAEGAPELGGEGGERIVGKALAYLASDFIECRSRLLFQRSK